MPFEFNSCQTPPVFIAHEYFLPEIIVNYTGYKIKTWKVGFNFLTLN